MKLVYCGHRKTSLSNYIPANNLQYKIGRFSLKNGRFDEKAEDFIAMNSATKNIIFQTNILLNETLFCNIYSIKELKHIFKPQTIELMNKKYCFKHM